jgi:hypothetical protein
VTEVPEDVRHLAEERAERRAAGDFPAADALRERIRDAGWDVTDAAGGYELVPLHPEAPRRLRAEEVPSVLDLPPVFDWSVHWLSEAWPGDIGRGIASFRAHHGSVHHVVVEAEPAPTAAWPPEAEVVRLSVHPGFGAARNAGLGRSRGRFVAVVDGSVEASGDVLSPLRAALEDPAVGVAGPVGVVTDDLRQFREAPGPEVDAVEGYLMAFPREVLERGVSFDPRYRFYRAADLDLSFQIRALDLRAVRVDVPIRRHEHRAWATTPAERRDRLSRRNFYRFLDRFRGRTDLLIGPRQGGGQTTGLL